MKESLGESSKIAFLGWLATVGTSACFLPTITNQSYFFYGASVTGLLVLLGIGLRLLRTPALLVVAAQLVTLAEMLILGFGEKLELGVLPTKATVTGLRDIVDSGMTVASEYAAPAPASAGLTMLVLVAIGVVGVLVDFFAAGVRRVPLTGLPLLTMYTVPVTALPDGVPFYGFLPGAVAYVALLLADERDRLSHWGRLVSRSTPGRESTAMDTSGLLATGRRVSVIAISTAVVLPIFIPAFSSSFLDGDRGTGPGTGDGPQLSFDDPMVSLASSLRRPEPVDLLTVSSDVVPDYLRLVVLDEPGPNAWRANPLDLGDTIPVSNALPRPTGVSDDVEPEQRQMTIGATAEFPQNSSWLPVPFFSQYVAIDSGWGYVPRDQTVTATTETSAAGLSDYKVTYSQSMPTREQLAAAGEVPADVRDEFAAVPADVPPGIERYARAVTSGAETPYDAAVLLQDFFRDSEEFTYDLDAAYGYGYESMTEFLQERRGFCQQFAATMAMMARTLGIPSRIVVGFLEPERRDEDGAYVITSDNVHAWPELYFEGAGWVRFEPTPGVGATLPSWAPRAVEPTASPTGPTPSLPTGRELTEDPRTDRPTETPGAGATDGSGGGTGSAPSKGWLVLLAGVALALAPMALRRGIRRARLSGPIGAAEAAESAWLELRDHIRDLRLPWTGSMTPRARERAVTGLLMGDGEGLAALNRLTLSVERSRYAASPSTGADPASDAVTVMASVSQAAERGQRVRALLLPSSLVPDLRRAWESLLQSRRSSAPTPE